MYCIVKTSQTERGVEVEKDNKKYATYYMESENIERLERQARLSKLKKSTIVNLALEEYFKKKDDEN